MITIPDRKLRGIDRKIALEQFASELVEISEMIGFPVSSRGWCYELEDHGLTKADFDFVEKLINTCRKEGILPIDFTAEEEGRQFSGVEEPTSMSPEEWVVDHLKDVLICGAWYTPNWWKDEKYYVQMVVEKIDLKTLFEPVCEAHHIPIATSKGWSSLLMRATYARRFREAEEMGLKCVLLYCGDHDPDGLRIGKFLRSNLYDVQDIYWEDGAKGYCPDDLVIDRFGLNYDFIQENKLSWINNLITGSKRNLADPSHKNHNMKYVQDYLKRFGARKCEGNALVKRPQQARELCKSVIENGNIDRETDGDNIWDGLGEGAALRFKSILDEKKKEMDDFRKETGLEDAVNEALKLVEDE